MSSLTSSECGVPRLDIRGAGLDHWAEIRHLHALSFRTLSSRAIEPSQSAAFIAGIYEPDYTVSLQTHDLLVAWLDQRPVGTAGWVPFDHQARSARITSVYVSPFFARLGIGRRLVAAAEARPAAAGFQAYAARAFHPAVGFFEAIGYSRSSHGVQSVGTEHGIPVTFMRKGGSETTTDPSPAMNRQGILPS
jgi:GNAT superfamily N-acetyltransferase